MKLSRPLLPLVVSFLLVCAACAPKPAPIIDEATVVAKNASVRQKSTSTSRTLVTLNPGDHVDVLERHDNWYRIKHGDMLEGWMEESTIVTNATMARIRQMAQAAQSESPQNTAVIREDANLRIDPGRNTDVIRKLDSGTKVEVLERTTTARTGSDTAADTWLKVRSKPTEVGWVLSSLVDFDVPTDLSGYTEGNTYTAVKPINQMQDPVAGEVHWYVVGERSSGVDPHVDFDGIRVFTWNLKKHRYETAYRERRMRGVYPIETGQQKGNPTFRIHELGADDATKTEQDYVMYGVIVRKMR